jgi:uncharacterized protein (DUF1499 family)
MKILVVLMSLVAFLLVALSGPLHRFGIINLGAAFTGFKYGVYMGIAALVLLVVLLAVQMISKRKIVTLNSTAIVAIFSAVAIIIPIGMLNKGTSSPAIHDISTDLVNPPKFDAVALLRVNASNPITYAGAISAEQQRQAYPELKTLTYSQPKAELVAAVEQATKNLGWALVDTDVNKGKIEATDTTIWFGFKDDIVVRVNDKGDKREVDIRSKSRIGASDLGKNAQRIHDFIEELDAVLGE